MSVMFVDFLGMCNQMSKFIPNLAEKTRVLRELLLKEREWTWELAQREAFSNTKEILSVAPVLFLYDPNAEAIVSVDASNFGLGAVQLQKQEDGETKPIAYVSRSLSEVEQRYAQIEEALAFTWACERLSDYLIGIKFHIQTDHKPLVPLFSCKSFDNLPVPVQRFRLSMMRFDYMISHVPGKQLVIADALSRAPSKEPVESDLLLQQETRAFVDMIVNSSPASEKRVEEIKLAQEQDEACREMKQYCLQDWPNKGVSV